VVVVRAKSPVPGDDQDYFNFAVIGLFGVGTACLTIDQARVFRAILDHEIGDTE